MMKYYFITLLNNIPQTIFISKSMIRNIRPSIRLSATLNGKRGFLGSYSTIIGADFCDLLVFILNIFLSVMLRHLWTYYPLLRNDYWPKIIQTTWPIFYSNLWLDQNIIYRWQRILYHTIISIDLNHIMILSLLRSFFGLYLILHITLIKIEFTHRKYFLLQD